MTIIIINNNRIIEEIMRIVSYVSVKLFSVIGRQGMTSVCYQVLNVFCFLNLPSFRNFLWNLKSTHFFDCQKSILGQNFWHTKNVQYIGRAMPPYSLSSNIYYYGLPNEMLEKLENYELLEKKQKLPQLDVHNLFWPII